MLHFRSYKHGYRLFQFVIIYLSCIQNTMISPRTIRILQNARPLHWRNPFAFGQQKKWSAGAQKAIWAHLMIECIKKKRPSFESIIKKSLSSQLLELKIPQGQVNNPEKSFSSRGFDKQIEDQMKKYFSEGVVLSEQVFNQVRFKQAVVTVGERQKNKKVVFYPTYLITGKMFQLFHQSRNGHVLVYGRWGVGKSIALVLRKILGDHVSDFLISQKSQSQEFKLLQPLLQHSSEKIIYWSIDKEDNPQQIIAQILEDLQSVRQRVQFKQDATPSNIKKAIDQYKMNQIIQELILSKKMLLKKKITMRAIIDQINVLASIKRKGMLSDKDQISLSKQIKSWNNKQNQDLSKILNFLISWNPIRFFNSSTNIQRNLISFDEDKIFGLRLASNHDGYKQIPFDMQERIAKNAHTNSGIFELGQFYINLMIQIFRLKNKVIFDHAYEIKMLKMFANYKWQFLPHALTMRIYLIGNFKTIDGKLKQEKKLLEVFQETLNQLNKQFSKTLKSQLQKFIKGQGETNKFQRNRIIKQCVYQAQKTQLQQINSISFQIPIKVKTYLQQSQITNYIDGNLMSLKSVKQQKDYKILNFIVYCSPTVFIDLVQGIYKQQITIFQERLKQLFKDNLRQVYYQPALQGLVIEAELVYLMKIKKLDFKFMNSTNQLYQIRKVFYFENITYKTQTSILERFPQIFDQKYIGQTLLFIPQVKNGRRISNSQKDKLSTTNFSFDILIVQKSSDRAILNFIQFTVSQTLSNIRAKYLDFFHMLQKFQEIKTRVQEDKQTTPAVNTFQSSKSLIQALSSTKPVNFSMVPPKKRSKNQKPITIIFNHILATFRAKSNEKTADEIYQQFVKRRKYSTNEKEKQQQHQIEIERLKQMILLKKNGLNFYVQDLSEIQITTRKGAQQLTISEKTLWQTYNCRLDYQQIERVPAQQDMENDEQIKQIGKKIIKKM